MPFLKPERSNTYGGVHRSKDARLLRRRAPLGSGVFLCDRCQRVYPESELVWQDGLKLDRSGCADLMTAVEMRTLMAEDMAKPDPFTPNEWGPADGFFVADAPIVSSITDGSDNIVEPGKNPVALTNGGSSATVKLNGFNLSSSDTIAYSDAGITDATSPTITATLVTLDVQASGAAQGLHDITYNGTTFRNVIRVRG